MAKSVVTVRGGEAGEVPFLRGILTRSLQEAGLSFDDSYRVASEVRDELRDVDSVTTDELRHRVLDHLAAFGDGAVRRYRAKRQPVAQVLVRFSDGQAIPFSRGRLRLELARCGLSVSVSSSVAEDLYAELVRRAVGEIAHPELVGLLYRRLGEVAGSVAAHRYLVWEEFHKSDRPLVILIGGTAGTGKSTLSALLAHELEIVRTQSTDMLREVMRMMVPERLLPVLHTSSFLAWEVLPFRESSGATSADRVVEGYLTQCELLSVAAEAVIQRATAERVSLILEGVHVLPSFATRVPPDADAIVVQAMIGVLHPEELRRRIQGRGRKVAGRRARRYLKHFDEIWQLQSFLLSEADRAHVPIVANDDVDRALPDLSRIVVDELARHFSGTLEGAAG